MKPPPPVTPYGVIAEFESAQPLIHAIEAAKADGYSVMEAYTPLPVHEVSAALGYKSRLPWLVFAGGALGAFSGFFMQYYLSVHEYALNIGGKPLNSWPAFIVVTFEMTILFAALSAVLGMLALNGLPRPHHPVHNVPAFEEASRHRFFLMILERDPKWDLDAVKKLFEAVHPMSIHEVPR
jgi:hypothetical protein